MFNIYTKMSFTVDLALQGFVHNNEKVNRKLI